MSSLDEVICRRHRERILALSLYFILGNLIFTPHLLYVESQQKSSRISRCFETPASNQALFTSLGNI